MGNDVVDEVLPYWFGLFVEQPFLIGLQQIDVKLRWRRILFVRRFLWLLLSFDPLLHFLLFFVGFCFRWTETNRPVLRLFFQCTLSTNWISSLLFDKLNGRFLISTLLSSKNFLRCVPSVFFLCVSKRRFVASSFQCVPCVYSTGSFFSRSLISYSVLSRKKQLFGM